MDGSDAGFIAMRCGGEAWKDSDGNWIAELKVNANAQVRYDGRRVTLHTGPRGVPLGLDTISLFAAIVSSSVKMVSDAVDELAGINATA